MKSLLSHCLLAFLMVVGGLQANATVKVLNIEFTSAGDLTEQLMATGYMKSGKVTYDGNQTLTLNNADFGNYFQGTVISSLESLTIKLVGTNSIVNGASNMGLMDIYVWGNLTITGDGSLYLNSGSKGNSMQLMGDGNALTITGGCRITIDNANADGFLFCGKNQSLTINHSYVRVATYGKKPIHVENRNYQFTLNLIKAKFIEPSNASWNTEGDDKYILHGSDQYGQGFEADNMTIVPDNDIPVESVAIYQKQNLELEVGDTYQLKAVVTPSNATGSVIWQSRNEAVAKVDKNGVVMAVGTGSTFIDLWGNSINSGIRDYVHVKVVQLPTSISVEPSSVTLTEIGQTFKPKVTILPSNATDISYTVECDESVVKFSRVNGDFTAVGYGTTQAKFKTVNGKEATCTITVKNPNVIPVSSISVSPTDLTLEGLNKTAKLTVNVLPENATDKSYYFSTSQSTVAKVSSDGTVTSVGYGQCRITVVAKDGSGKTAACQVLVKEPEPEIPEGTFFADTPDYVSMRFRVTDSDAKECEVFGFYDDNVWIYETAVMQSLDEPVTIPSEVKGLKVIGISDYAFYQCYQIPQIIIPEGIRYIGFDSFEACDKLTEIRIPSTVTEIGTIAFAACEELHHVYMLMPTPPEAGNQAFDYLPEDATLHVRKGTKSLWTAPWTEWFKTITDDVPAHIDSMTADDETPPVYYNLSGQRVNNSHRGIVIERRGNTTCKVRF